MSALGLPWLPIVLAAVIVFVASSVIHMAPLWHRGDYRGVPGESEVMDGLRPLNIPPGDYFIPWATSPREMKTPQFQERMRAGPVALLTVMRPGGLSMGRPLLLWFGYLLVVTALSAYVARLVLPPGTPYPQVFRLVMVTSFMGYALALVQNSIWLRRSWLVTFKAVFDGLIYAGLTAGTFGWLWPHVPH
jgi:hypothetical protein